MIKGQEQVRDAFRELGVVVEKCQRLADSPDVTKQRLLAVSAELLSIVIALYGGVETDVEEIAEVEAEVAQ